MASRDVDAGRYQRHRPEQTPLCQIVDEYYPAFTALLAKQGRELQGIGKGGSRPEKVTSTRLAPQLEIPTDISCKEKVFGAITIHIPNGNAICPFVII